MQIHASWKMNENIRYYRTFWQKKKTHLEAQEEWVGFANIEKLGII